MENKNKNEQNQQKFIDNDNLNLTNNKFSQSTTVKNKSNQNSDLQRKLQILVKAYKEEHSKYESLQKMVDEIKLEKIQNEALITKLRNENNSLQDALSKKDPNFFDNLINYTKVLTEKEIQQINEEKKLCEEQNIQLIKQIEKLTQEKEESENKLKEEITKLNEENEKFKNIVKQNQTTIESLNAILKDNESNINYKDIQNTELKRENSEMHIKIKKLEEQNNIYLESIKSFKLQITELSKLENQYKENNKMIASENYMFKGTLINHKDNNEKFFGKKIFIFFGNLEKSYIYVVIEVDNFFCVNVNDFGINYIEKSKSKVGICFIDNTNKKIRNFGFDEEDWSLNNTIKKMACEFSEEECKYIMDFYRIKKKIYDKKIKTEEDKKDINNLMLNDF